MSFFVVFGFGMGKNQDPGSRIRHTASNKNSNGLQSSVADPGSGIGSFLTPWSGIQDG